MKEEKLKFEHRGREYEAVIRRRPFREGAEIVLDLNGHTVTVGELGLGTQAAIDKLKGEIDKYHNNL